MSTIKVNTIENRTGSSITIGGSSTTSLDLASTITGGTLTNGPAFEAYLSTNQDISDSTTTKVEYDTEVFDTDNCYDNSTNYRFTPTVAGKYFVYVQNSDFSTSSSDLNTVYNYIYKNGTIYKYSSIGFVNNPGRRGSPIVTAIIDMNGTTDYLEGFAHIDVSSGTPRVEANTKSTYFGAYRIIGA